jgi:arylformamidase
MAEGWIDISVPLRTGMVHWPGDPDVQFERLQDMERGDVCTVSRMALGAHTGTHMDAPLHYLRTGKSIDQMPLSATIGRARVIAIADPVAIAPEDLRPHSIRRGERILFKTRNSARCWQSKPFFEDYVFLSPAAARYLAARRVRTVGVDYLSVGTSGEDGVETHRALLEAGVWIIEGLDLSRVQPGKYDLVCLPLRIAGGDGAPARAVLRGPR